MTIAAVAGAFTARAQGGAPPQPAADQATATPAPQAPVSATPIPLSDVIAQAEIASSTLREIAAGVSTGSTADVVERELPALTDEINARLEETAQVVEGATSLDKLRNFQADWRTLAGNLPQWRNGLIDRARKLDGDLARLDALSERWRKTLDELRNTAAPPEAVARVEEIVNAAANTRREIEAQRARVVALQNRVAEQQKRIDGAVATIEQAREAIVGQLLVQDSPPIWSEAQWTRAGVARGLSDSLATQFDGLRAFAARNAGKLVIHFLVFVLLAAILILLRRRVRPKVEAEPDLKSAAVIFYLPVPTALALTILFSSWVYPQTPQVLDAILGAVALVPAVIILRRLVETSLYPLLYSLVVFYFIDQLRVIADTVPTVARPLFLAETFGGFLFFLWLYRTRLSREVPGDGRQARIFRVVRVVSLVVLPLFAAAFVANAFGYVNLARLVGNAVLSSLYVAVILYGGVRILDGLIVFAMRFRPLSSLKAVRNHAPTIQAKAEKFTRFVALVLWLLVTLEFFTLRGIVFENIRAVLTAELSLGSLGISAGDVLLFLFVVWAAFMLSRFIRFALEEEVYPRFLLAPGIPYAVSTILNYVILLVGFLFAVAAVGLDLTRMTILVSAFGVGIGFGLQNVVNNFVSGLILLFERPVRVGDEIAVGDASGTVQRIGIRASLVKQWDNSEIIVPNSKLISENVKNWTFSARTRGMEIPVRVAHGTDTQFVARLLTATAAAHPLIAEDPEPQALLTEFASQSLNFKLRAWTTHVNRTGTISSELAIAVSRALAEHGIAFPQVGPTVVMEK